MVQKKVKEKKKKKKKKMFWEEYNILHIGFVALVVFGVSYWLFSGGGESPSVNATTTTLTTTATPNQQVDYGVDHALYFGSNFEDTEYVAHRVGFKGLIGHFETYQNFIYASNGEVDFIIRAVPTQKNRMDFHLLYLNTNCRKNDVYVDGEYIGSLFQGFGDIEFQPYQSLEFIPKREIVSVKIVNVGNPLKLDTECYWGFDISSVKISIDPIPF